MENFKTYSDLLNYKGHRIITKRLEPYDVIEAVKKNFDINEYIFNGRTKMENLKTFLDEIKASSKDIYKFGLYMKNVNKFYLITVKNNPDNMSETEILHKTLITKEYGFSEEEQINKDGIEYSTDTDYALECIDLGKAEASFIMAL